MSNAKFNWLGFGGFTCSEQFQAHGWSKQTHWYANEIGDDRLSQRELRCNNTSDATYYIGKSGISFEQRQRNICKKYPT